MSSSPVLNIFNPYIMDSHYELETAFNSSKIYPHTWEGLTEAIRDAYGLARKRNKLYVSLREVVPSSNTDEVLLVIDLC